MDEKRLQLYRSAVHPLVSILLPFLFLLTSDRLLKAILWPSFQLVTPGGLFFLVLAVGICEAASANYLFRERVGEITARARELLVVLIVSFLLVMVLRGVLVTGDINPLRPEVFYSLALTAIQWLLSFWIHRGLKEREVYLSLLREKKGMRLRIAAREFGVEAARSRKSLVWAKRFLILFQAFVLALVLILYSSAQAVPGRLVFLVLVNGGFGVLFLALLNSLLEEDSLLVEGFTVQPRLIRRRLAVLAALLLSAVLISLLLLGGHSLFPASYLQAVLDRLHDLLSPAPRYGLVKPRPPQQTETASPSFVETPSSPASTSVESLSTAARFIRIAGLCALIIIGLLLLFFLIRPFLDRNARERLKQIHPLRSLAKRAASMYRFCLGAVARFVAWLGSPKKGMRRAARAFVKALSQTAALSRESPLRAPEADRSKRHSVNRVVRGYLRLIRWGERRGVRFQTTIGPMDYVLMLGRAVPESEKPLRDTGSMFEEFVYSHHRIEPMRIAEYFDTIRMIVRTKATAAR